jgi:hypothetical protein
VEKGLAITLAEKPAAAVLVYEKLSEKR